MSKHSWKEATIKGLERQIEVNQQLITIFESANSAIKQLCGNLSRKKTLLPEARKEVDEILAKLTPRERELLRVFYESE